MAMRLWKTAAAALAVAGLSIGQAPASAAPAYADDHFKLCIPGDDCDLLYIKGEIQWGNRTAYMFVTHRNSVGGTLTGHFDAFAGSNKIDNHVTYSSYNFPIGNPNLPGGINRIRSQACLTGTDGQFVCSTQWNDIRD